jgi:hypothetical protein
VFLIAEDKGSTPLPPQPARPDGSSSARQPLSCSCSGGPSGRCFVPTYLCRRFFFTIPFRIRTYKKTGGRGPSLPLLPPLRPRTPLQEGQQAIQPTFRGGADTMDPARNHWYIACHTEGLSSSISASPVVRAGSR